MTLPDQIPANTLVSSIDIWRRNLFATWRMEQNVTSYANGGPPPSDEDTCEDAIVPLGFAQTRMRKEMAPLLDPLYLEPGIIDGDYFNPVINDAQRTITTQRYVVKEINNVTWKRLIPTLQAAAGRVTTTGRAFIYWKSPNDWVPRNGQMIYPISAGTDILDSTFREWAFMEKLSLRDVETILKSGLNPDKEGWRKDGLEKLKLWIMASEAQKYANGAGDTTNWGEYNPEAWLAQDLSNSNFCEPVDVYWYFRKNGKVTKGDPRYGGHEEVDVYCISRYGSQSEVATVMKDTFTRIMELKVNTSGSKEWEDLDKEFRKKQGDLDVDGRKKIDCNERLLFFKKGMFRSVQETLVCHVDDVSISGEQRLHEVRGSGRTMMPKLAAMEGLMTSMIQGVSFGVTPNFEVATSLGSEYLEQIQRGGIRSGQVFPQGVKLVEKNNSFTGIGQAANFIQMLDTGVAADSTSAGQGIFGGSSNDFASQAAAELQGSQATLGRKLQLWLLTLDLVAERVASVLCRHWPDMKEQYPCYQDAQRLRQCLKVNYKIHEDEWDTERYHWRARRLAGNMTRQQSIMVNTQLLQIVGPVMPSLTPFFAKEILRGHLGDTVADELTDPDQNRQEDQTEQARMNVTVSFINGQPVPPKPMDDPMIHSGIASEVAQARIQAAMQAGEVAGQELVGVMAVLGYAGAQIARLPEQIGKPAMDKLVELGKAIQSLPVMSAGNGELTEKDKLTLQLKAQGQQRLERVDEDKRRQNTINTQLQMAKLADDRDMKQTTMKNMDVARAKQYQDMEMQLSEADMAPLDV